jgi:multidrug efflux pump subunit AcrA (membrane-fusion protein)
MSRLQFTGYGLLSVLVCLAGALTAFYLTSGNAVAVASPLDGVVAAVVTEVESGEDVPPHLLVLLHSGGKERRYRRLRVGDSIEEGQLLARLDDRLIEADVALADTRIGTAQADLVVAEKNCELAKADYDLDCRLRCCVSQGELRLSKQRLDRSVAEAHCKRERVHGAEAERQRTRVELEMHEIRSPIRGVVHSLARRPGEAVKRYEPILYVQPAPE